MGSPCLFTRQQALKMGYFSWLCVKSLNHLHTELNLGYLRGTKFCLESKASFTDTSSIASFEPFLISWLRHYFSFSDSSVVNLKSSRWPKYTQLGTIFQKKIMFYSQTFILILTQNVRPTLSIVTMTWLVGQVHRKQLKIALSE